LYDHTALAAALDHSTKTSIVFVYDTNILANLRIDDRRMTFIEESLREIDAKLREHGSRLIIRRGDPVKEIPKLAEQIKADAVFTNHDYESSAKKRDSQVAKILSHDGIAFESFKDQVIFERQEILTGSNTPFKVFTAYFNAWRKALRAQHFAERAVKLSNLMPAKDLKNVSEDIDSGFKKQKLWLLPGESEGRKRLKKFANEMKDYKELRDFPAAEATSGLSVHLRFGTVSIRDCVREGLRTNSMGAQTWRKELVWREFYQMILDQFPHVEKTAFREEFANIKWPGKKEHFEAWCEGRTGFPIVDAAMIHFNETGWMHNRLRMIVASFLVKDLLIDWRKGEQYFAEHLLDFDLAANNGGWQWCASTGCDAQPYFRIFNPESQEKKFDPDREFISQYVKKEIDPIVDHKVQREKALRLFKKT